MTGPPRQPWSKGDAPLTVTAMQQLLDELEARAMARLEERAMAREQRMKIFLALVPLLWVGIAAALWFFNRL